MALYHVYSCYELGVETVATIRIPCHCENCKEQILKPWIKYKDILLNKNEWYFVRLEQRSKRNQKYHKFMDEDANFYRKDLSDHVGDLMYSEIAEGNVGAVVVDDEETWILFS